MTEESLRIIITAQPNELPYRMTIAEVAARLRISESFAWKLARTGRIKSFRVGEKRIIIPREAVVEFEKSGSDSAYVGDSL